MLQVIPLNTVGRDFLVGDIHTQFEKLQMALAAAGFDPARGDRLIATGDLVGRAEGGNRVASLLAQPWFFSVAGNHERMAIDAALGVAEEGEDTPVLAPEVISALQRLPLAIELHTEQGAIGIVHADVPGNSWDYLRTQLDSATPYVSEDIRQVCQWSKARGTGKLQGQPVKATGLRAVVVGHTPVAAPTWSDNVLMIDTATSYDGQFQLVDARTLEPVPLCRPVKVSFIR